MLNFGIFSSYVPYLVIAILSSLYMLSLAGNKLMSLKEEKVQQVIEHSPRAENNTCYFDSFPASGQDHHGNFILFYQNIVPFYFTSIQTSRDFLPGRSPVFQLFDMKLLPNAPPRFS